METRESIGGASSGTGITSDKWTDMFYVCEDPKYDAIVTAFATIKINKDLRVPVTPIVLRAREFVESLVINCVYYVTQLCDLGQSDINKLMFLNAARDDTDPANAAAYETRKGGAGRMLKDAVERPSEKSPYFDRVFPVLRKWFKHTEVVSEKYLEEVWRSYIGGGVSSQFVEPDDDFKKVVMYFVMTGKMKLTDSTVLRYINGNFCPIEYLLTQLRRGELLRHRFFLQSRESFSTHF